MRHWLAWLARSMRDHDLSEFHLDRLQRNWLPTTTQQRLVTLIPIISAALLSGLAVGLGFGLLFGLLFGGMACLQYLVLRSLLVYHRFAPLRYIRFLDEATERLFLRRAGSGYIFIHRLLLDYFADLNTTRPPAEAEQSAAFQG
jgi:hypothetical protein